MRTFIALTVLVKLLAATSLEEIKRRENKAFWQHKGLQDIQKALELHRNEKVAKNIILFIGDGMGLPTITAARHLKRQLRRSAQLSFDNFPHSALSMVILNLV